MEPVKGRGQQLAAEVLEIDDPSWRRFVATQPLATCFHEPGWARTIADAYRLKTFVVASRDHSGKIAAGVPLVEVRGLSMGRRWVCLPFTDECGPLAVSAQAAEVVVQQAQALSQTHGMAGAGGGGDPRGGE